MTVQIKLNTTLYVFPPTICDRLSQSARSQLIMNLVMCLHKPQRKASRETCQTCEADPQRDLTGAATAPGGVSRPDSSPDSYQLHVLECLKERCHDVHLPSHGHDADILQSHELIMRSEVHPNHPRGTVKDDGKEKRWPPGKYVGPMYRKKGLWGGVGGGGIQGKATEG